MIQKESENFPDELEFSPFIDSVIQDIFMLDTRDIGEHQ